MEFLSILKDKETMNSIKELAEKGKLLLKILPKFEITEVEMENAKYVAVLFDHSPANIARIEAIENVFTDILPPFQAVSDFTLNDAKGKPTLYTALLFEVQKERP